MSLPPRLQKELKTIQIMLEIYCRQKHGMARRALCRECREVLAYAEKRLAHCPFRTDKPTCGKCPVHCYRNDMRSRVKEVMRYSGPKMLWHHPVLALRHLLNGMKKTPAVPSCRRQPPGSTDSTE